MDPAHRQARDLAVANKILTGRRRGHFTLAYPPLGDHRNWSEAVFSAESLP